MDFVADRLGVLHLCEEALVLAPIGGGASSVVSRTPGDFNDEAPMLRSEPVQGSNPTVSNIRFVIYLLFIVFRRFSGGTPLSPSRPPYDQFPYGLMSPVDANTWGL